MAIVTVTNNLDSGAGSLRAAIAQAGNGDTIQFNLAAGSRTITLTSGELLIDPGKNLIIDGAAAPGLTLSGNNASRIFHLNSNAVQSLTVKNMILANAYTNEFGGAIKTEYRGVLVVDNVQFNSNVADRGGGAIFGSFEGNVTVTNSQFTGNRATAGNDERGAGAISFYGTGNLTVQGSTFTNNLGINGGAINSLNGTLLVENSTFVGNDVSAATVATGQANPTLRGYGGAIYTDRANNATTIRNSLFENNTARAGGGALYLFNDPEDTVTIDTTILRGNKAIGLTGGEGGNGGAIDQVRNGLGSGSLMMTNSSLINNQANAQGGGLWVNQTNSSIVNTTFAGNSAPNNFGGAITTYSPLTLTNSTLANNSATYAGALAAGSDNLATVRNTIFANNTSANTGVSFNGNQQTNRPIINSGGNLQFPNGPAIAPGIAIGDPKLGALQQTGNVVFHPLLDGSAAINTGTTGGPSTDARGVLRDSRPDIGSFELGIPGLDITNVRIREGNSGSTNAVFTVSLSSASDQVVTVNYATANGTAIAGQDYQALSGSLSFAAGERSKTIRVQVLGDLLVEGNESFRVNLSGASNATLLNSQGTAIIVNDDGPTLRSSSADDPQSLGTSFYRQVVGLWRSWRTPLGEAILNNGATSQSALNPGTNQSNQPLALAPASNPGNGLLGQQTLLG